MSTSFGALVVFGSGPGVGHGIATLFAERGFAKIIILSRDADRLAKEADKLRSLGNGPEVKDIAIDLGNPESVEVILQKVQQSLGDTLLECVLYNAARTGKSHFFNFPSENLENDLKIAVISLYKVAQWAIPHMLQTATTCARSPALLVTSGLLATQPAPAMFSLAVCKSGQRSLVQSLHKEFETKGVHVGLITIGGSVSDSSKVTNARNIAEEAWKMFGAAKGQGQFEALMMDPAYLEHQHTAGSPATDGGLDVNHSNNSKPQDSGWEPSVGRAVETRPKVDVYELTKGLVQDVLQRQHGYSFECMLVEPHSSVHQTTQSSAPTSRATIEQLNLPLSLSHVKHLLEHFDKIMGWPNPGLVDTRDLLMTARAYLALMIDISAEGLSTLLKTTRLPMDSTALLFAALALGAVAKGDLNQGRFYFDTSLEMAKLFVSQQTLDLCLAYYLQHLLALRFGTSSYAQGIMAHAFLVAHHLGIQRNSHGNPGLRLFLLIYMADQYGSTQQNTEPLIRASSIDVRTFENLAEAEPHLQTLIDLVTINGYVIEHSYRNTVLTDDEIRALEARIGELCAHRKRPLQSDSGTFKSNYDLIAYIHMMCCRLKLRVPGLATQSSIIASISTCVHAAQGVLAGYHQLYRPILNVLCGAHSMQQKSLPEQLATPNAASLAVTWRQVRRIMTSTFVIIFAYQHGELLHDDASRFVAMTRLLLEYPRWRWGGKLDELIQTLHDISNLANLAIVKQLRALLPEQSEQFLQHLAARQPLLPSETSIVGQNGQDIPSNHWSATCWPPIYDMPFEYDLPDFGNGMQAEDVQQLWSSIWNPADVL
ncbi:uncharacterized protein AB675_12075 [Cyphellophora attinorum]|uniref:Transcription factor domain-containing protein n=1 Tax=Cyphellophora attinorum TaxID=1664694 RepID=A0A0N1H8M2_9EURO|nr:uncharacterized protein AB675_12075 [Phialophora attinorum]KPI38304.1 hypothetical protein AB675_12075 [Phialophora attinorum]